MCFSEALVQAVNDENLQGIRDVMRGASHQFHLSPRKYIAGLIVDESKDYNLLHYAAARGFAGFFVYLQQLNEMRDTGKPDSGYTDPLRAQDKGGHTPLHVAVLNNHLNVVKAIYGFFGISEIKIAGDGTVNVDIESEGGPLDEEWGLPMRLFLAIKDNAGRTALEEAQHAKHTEITTWLQHVGGSQGVL